MKSKWMFTPAKTRFVSRVKNLIYVIEVFRPSRVYLPALHFEESSSYETCTLSKGQYFLFKPTNYVSNENEIHSIQIMLLVRKEIALPARFIEVWKIKSGQMITWQPLHELGMALKLFDRIHGMLLCCFWSSYASTFDDKQKSKCRGKFEIQSQEIWPAHEILVSTLEKIQVPNGTGPGVRRSNRPLLSWLTRCKSSIETSSNLVNSVHVIRYSSVTRWRFSVMFNQRRAWVWSCSRMSCNRWERGTSCCLIRSPYRP